MSDPSTLADMAETTITSGGKGEGLNSTPFASLSHFAIVRLDWH
jgi:hypothetical protein